MDDGLFNCSVFFLYVLVLQLFVVVFYRMYPVVIGNGRNLQSDAVIFGYHIPKGVSVLICFDSFGSRCQDQRAVIKGQIAVNLVQGM